MSGSRVRAPEPGEFAARTSLGQNVRVGPDIDEVLVSSTVRDLVAGSGSTFADRRDYELKGIPGAWRLFAATP
jgi:class 3 adenylate cyclase